MAVHKGLLELIILVSVEARKVGALQFHMTLAGPLIPICVV